MFGICGLYPNSLECKILRILYNVSFLIIKRCVVKVHGTPVCPTVGGGESFDEFSKKRAWFAVTQEKSYWVEMEEAFAEQWLSIN